MINLLIEKAYEKIQSLSCCHSDERVCCCYECLKKDFWERPDDYDCEKKINYYVAKYAASYSSEFYNYLAETKLLEKFDNQTISILSMGCGFSPDFYSITRYIKDKSLNVTIVYKGLDNCIYWPSVRQHFPNANYELFDLCKPFTFDGYNIIVMSKVFSTLCKHDQNEIFLANLHSAITSSHELTLIFNDINTNKMGRDDFDRSVQSDFSEIKRFYTGNPPYYDASWNKIKGNTMVFPVILNAQVDPLNEIRNYVYFEYRK